MATLFSDDFNRANNTDLGTSWTEVKGNHSIVSNAASLAAYNSANNFADLRADTDAHAAVADCKVTGTRVSGTSFDALVYARGSGTDSTFTGYVLNVYGSNNIEVYRFNSGASTLLGARNQTHANGDRYSLQVSGTGATVTFKVFRNGSQVGADLTDSSGSRITAAGQTGIGNWAASASVWDDFLVEDLGGGGDVSVALTGQSSTGSAGSMAPASAKEISGSSIASAQGALAPAVSPALSGQATTVSAGTIAPELSIALTGLSATIAHGTVTASTGGNVTAALSGLAVATAQGAVSTEAVKALTGSALTSAQATVTPAFSKAVTGVSASFAQGTLARAVSIGLSGQAGTISQGTVTPLTGITIELTGQAASIAQGAFTPELTGVLTGEALTSALGNVGLPATETEFFAGGFVVAFEREQARRARERRKRQELEEESERIEEETTRQIAALLREQEAKDARRAELARLSDLVARAAQRGDEAALSPRVHKAIRTAAAKQTAWALFQLEREMGRSKEEEEFILQALRMALEHEELQ